MILKNRPLSFWRDCAVVLALCAISLALAWAALHLLRAQAPVTTEEAIAAQQRRITAAEALEAHAKGVSAPLVQLLVATEREKRVLLYKQVDEANAAAERELALLEKLMSTAHDMDRLHALQGLRARYSELFLAAVEQLELDGSQGVQEQFWAPTRNAMQAMEQAAHHFANEERVSLDVQRDKLAAFESSAQSLMALLAGLFAVAAMAGAVLARLLRP